MPAARKGAALALAAALVPAAALAAPAETPSASVVPGKVLFESRLRYEQVDQAGLPNDAQALTLRTRLGWETPEVARLKALVELENVTALVDDYADTVRPKPGFPAIPDPELTELNRAQISWTGLPKSEVVLGRQRIVLNNARFVGNGGWRQNEQTFDAVKFTTSAFKPAALTYVYIDRVHRNVGPDHPQGEYDGAIHLLQADRDTPAGKVSGYGYLMDIDNAPAQSAQTWGARLAGARPAAEGVSFAYELEYARQSDWGNAPLDFDLDYVLASGGVRTPAAALDLVYERLDGDGARGFQTPLATLHGFQGWSDVIGATPAFGVRDVYLRGSATAKPKGLQFPLKFAAEVHEFRDADGAFRLGRELDASVTAPVNKHWTVGLKGARFNGDRVGFPDTTRAWAWLEYKY